MEEFEANICYVCGRGIFEDVHRTVVPCLCENARSHIWCVLSSIRQALGPNPFMEVRCFVCGATVNLACGDYNRLLDVYDRVDMWCEEKIPLVWDSVYSVYFVNAVCWLGLALAEQRSIRWEIRMMLSLGTLLPTIALVRPMTETSSYELLLDQHIDSDLWSPVRPYRNRVCDIFREAKQVVISRVLVHAGVVLLRQLGSPESAVFTYVGLLLCGKVALHGFAIWRAQFVRRTLTVLDYQSDEV